MAQRVNADNFEEKVLKSELPVLLDFYSDTCMPCKVLNGPLGDIEDNYEDKVQVYKVNVNYDEALAEKYDVSSVPTLVFIKAGEEVARNVGVMNYDQIQEMISK